MYEVLFYEAEASPPAYRIIDTIEGDMPEQALQNHLQEILTTVRETYFATSEYLSDAFILDNLFVIEPGDMRLGSALLTAARAG